MALLIPAIAYTLFLCLQPIQIGFRHFLPAYVPMLMLATRGIALRREGEAPSEPSAAAAAATPARTDFGELSRGEARPPGRSSSLLTTACWLLTTLTILDSLRLHPDYLSYTNFPRKNTHLAISDSNLDWGQSLKQVRRWIDDNQPLINKRPLHIAYFGDPEGDGVRHYLGETARPLTPNHDRLPTAGLLLASPVHLAGVYGELDPLRPLRQAEQNGRVSPLAIIGHTMRLYDLDRLNNRD